MRELLTRSRVGRLLLLTGLIAAMVPVALALGVSEESGFEDDDGNLAAATLTDWNSFAPVTWTGAAPNREAEDSFDGWSFDGLEDAQAVTSDNAFAGGTKQDDSCPDVITAKAPNKDDLRRVYFASKIVDGHVYLNLAWVRIPQNTTSPSAHVAFEFNQSETLCGGDSDGLVQRSTANGGDVLIVYDFEGGSTDTPTLRLSRWIGSGTCEVGSASPPCWGVAQTLGEGVAEARVNTSAVGQVSDAIHPAAPPAQTLGLNEFGEAGIDLTDAGVFPPGQCRSFGNAFAVSRTSGSSSTAQMKDLVGPGDIDLRNCGTIEIIKETIPAGVTQDFEFTSTITGTQLSCSPDATPATFTLNDGSSVTDSELCENVPAGTSTVTEGADPAGFTFDHVTCVGENGASATTSGKVATITMTGDGKVTCTYFNRQNLGAIKVHKDRKHAASGTGDHPHAGVNFTVNGVTKPTDAAGDVCFDGLTFGTYTVSEAVPAGYVSDDPTKEVIVDNNATCAGAPYAGETVSFLNTPLTDLTVSVNSQVDGGTASTIDCVVASGSTGPNGDGSVTAVDLVPGTYTCTVVIDP